MIVNCECLPNSGDGCLKLALVVVLAPQNPVHSTNKGLFIL